MENIPIWVSNLVLNGWWGSVGVLGCFRWTRLCSWET